ncbi:Membrane protein-like protein [metagenome]|uniref:Membrane protein-like protein n=1 Tax=metagenome TaxID=256318 RepID=A0A2P2CCI5_9ZZZZ
MTIPKDVLGLAGVFASSGVVHVTKPSVYQPLMPAWVPRHREVILASGVAELACAAGLLHPRTRVVAGWASAALLVVIFPGNLKMANDARRSNSQAVRAAAFARLPLQLPLIRTALKAARGA